jgi:hypothetical protein
LVFEVDGIIFWCYKGVGEVFWSCNGLKIEVFFLNEKRHHPNVDEVYWGCNSLKIKYFYKKKKHYHDFLVTIIVAGI